MGCTPVSLEDTKKEEAISASHGSTVRDVGSGILLSVSGGSAMSPPCQRMQDPGIWSMTLSPFYSFSSVSSNGFLKLSIFFFFFLKSNQHFCYTCPVSNPPLFEIPRVISVFQMTWFYLLESPGCNVTCG